MAQTLISSTLSGKVDNSDSAFRFNQRLRIVEPLYKYRLGTHRSKMDHQTKALPINLNKVFFEGLTYKTPYRILKIYLLEQKRKVSLLSHGHHWIASI